jgi:F1F0 ATPase subunit 2
MNEILYMILVLAAGFLLGILFFGGLWLTVKKVGTSKSPALLVLGSFIVRIAIVVVGFYFIGAGNWRFMLMSFAGFLIGRFVMMRFTKLKRSNILYKEAHYET